MTIYHADADSPAGADGTAPSKLIELGVRYFRIELLEEPAEAAADLFRRWLARL